MVSPHSIMKCPPKSGKEKEVPSSGKLENQSKKKPITPLQGIMNFLMN